VEAKQLLALVKRTQGKPGEPGQRGKKSGPCHHPAAEPPGGQEIAWMKRRWARQLLAALVSSAALVGIGCQTYSQEQQDRDLLFAFNIWVRTTWNGNVASFSNPSPDFTLSEPGGGTLRVTGQVSGGTHSLKHTFTNYPLTLVSEARVVFDTMTGIISQNGTVNATVTLASENLVVSGTLTHKGYDPVALEGELDLDCSFDSSSDIGSGTINGRSPVKWNYSGGGSGGGSGGDACASFTSDDCCRGTPGIQALACYIDPKCNCPQGTDIGGIHTDGLRKCICR